MKPKFKCDYSAIGGPIAKMERNEIQTALQGEVPESVVKELLRIKEKYKLLHFSVIVGITERDLDE